MNTVPGNALLDRRVLVAEDEYFIARDIGRALHAIGAEVVGPLSSLDAVQVFLAQGQHLDAAILDINLNGELVFPVLESLTLRDIPVVFATGYEQAAVPAPYQHIPRWQKPFDPEALVQVLPGLVRSPSATPAGGGDGSW
jgi:CheY-like chemotaxis protein